jgi:hypothetical protein
MALPYKKWSEDDVKNRNVVEAGDYKFRVVGAMRKRTKSGANEMLEIDLEFTDNNGVVKKLRDWIVFMDGMDWKLRHLANTTGLLEMYEDGSLDDYHFKNKIGIVKLGTKDDEYEGEKRKINFVKDYVKQEDMAAQADKSSLDDDIPNM